MASRMVINRETAVREVASAARRHAGRASEAIAKRLAAELQEGETLPNFPQLFELASRLLHRQADGLVAADEGHFFERGLDKGARKQRALVLAAVRKVLIDVRLAFDGAFGDEAASAVFGFEGPTPRDAQSVLRQAQRVLARLDEPLPPLPLPRLAGIEANPLAWAAQLRPPTEDLARILEDAADSRRDAQGLLTDKHAHLAEFDAAYLHTARLVEALFGFAEMPELARQVRPRGRRALNRRVEAPQEPAPPTEAPPILP